MPRRAKAAKAPFWEIAYRELRRRILENEMPAGFQATEQEVAAILEMSRTPTREALVRLESEGLVEIRPRHGMRVLPVSADDMREIYQVLTGLEASAAASVAAKGLSDAEIGRLERAVSDMDRALKRDDLNAWAEADERFHRLLVDYSDNRRLQNVVETLLGQAYRVHRLTLKLRPKPTRSNMRPRRRRGGDQKARPGGRLAGSHEAPRGKRRDAGRPVGGPRLDPALMPAPPAARP